MVGSDDLGIETLMKQSQVGRVAYQGPRIVIVEGSQRIEGREGQQEVSQSPLMYK